MAKGRGSNLLPVRGFRIWPGLALLGMLTACAEGIPLPDVPPASSIPQLEARADQAGADVTTLVRLGAAYRAVERSREAIPVLERAQRLDPDEPSVWFFLGLAYSDVDRPGDAVSAYESFARFLPPGSVRDHIEARIRLLRREELRVAVREAIVNEEQLRGGRPPDASTLAVLPFLFDSPNQELRPLRRALAS
ncbi:MAG: tetratricopeptide repeat protein, partial [Gemmatimonadota bacterium]